MNTCINPSYQPAADAIGALLNQARKAEKYTSWDAATSAGGLSHHKAYREVLRIALYLPVPTTVAFHLGQAAGSNSVDAFCEGLQDAINALTPDAIDLRNLPNHITLYATTAGQFFRVTHLCLTLPAANRVMEHDKTTSAIAICSTGDEITLLCENSPTKLGG